MFTVIFTVPPLCTTVNVPPLPPFAYLVAFILKLVTEFAPVQLVGDQVNVGSGNANVPHELSVFPSNRFSYEPPPGYTFPVILVVHL